MSLQHHVLLSCEGIYIQYILESSDIHSQIQRKAVIAIYLCIYIENSLEDEGPYRRQRRILSYCILCTQTSMWVLPHAKTKMDDLLGPLFPEIQQQGLIPLV